MALRASLLACLLLTGCLSMPELEALHTRYIWDLEAHDRATQCIREIRAYEQTESEDWAELVEAVRRPDVTAEDLVVVKLERPRGVVRDPDRDAFRQWLDESKPTLDAVVARLEEQCFLSDMNRLLDGEGSIGWVYEGVDGPWDARLVWTDKTYLTICSFDRRIRWTPLRSCQAWLTSTLWKGWPYPGVKPSPDPEKAKRYSKGVRREPGDE